MCAQLGLQVQAAAAMPEIDDMYLQLHVVTDLLIFYGIRGQGGQAPFNLAYMLFKYEIEQGRKKIVWRDLRLMRCSMIFRQELFGVFLKVTPRLWPPALVRWVRQLSFFLSFFPGSFEVRALRKDANPYGLVLSWNRWNCFVRYMQR
jgi:hypothetical protein